MKSKDNKQTDALVAAGLGSTFFRKGDNDRSLRYYKRAHSIRRADNNPYSYIDTKLYTCIGTIHAQKGETQLAIDNFKKTLSIRQQLFGMKGDLEAVASCNNIGTVYYHKNDLLLALQWFQKALDILPGDDSTISLTIESASNTSESESERKKIDREYNAREAEINSHTSDGYESRKAEVTVKTYSNNGSIQYRLGQYDRAIEYYKFALSIQKGDTNEPITREKKERNYASMASICCKIANSHSQTGNRTKALEYHGGALKMRQEVFGDNAETAASLHSIGNEYFQVKNYNKALSAYLSALETRERVLEENHPDIAATGSSIGCVMCQQGNYIEAVEYFREAIKIQEAGLLRDSSLAKMYCNAGTALKKAGNYDAALENYENAYDIQKELLGSDCHPSLCSIIMHIGSVHCKRGAHEDALQYFTKCNMILNVEEVHDSAASATSQSSSISAKLYNHFATTYSEIGDYEEAATYYTKKLSIQEITLGLIHEDTAKTYHNIGRTYESKGTNEDFDKALNYYKLCFASRKSQFGIFDRRTMNAGVQIARMWIVQCKPHSK
jgi:tetratricopeptide (TPR) repeat protein